MYIKKKNHSKWHAGRRGRTCVIEYDTLNIYNARYNYIISASQIYFVILYLTHRSEKHDDNYIFALRFNDYPVSKLDDTVC